MKQRKDESKRIRVMHLWTMDEVAKAIPYIRSITGSLREHWLDMLNVQREMDKSASAVAKPKAPQLLKNQRILDERQRARDKFNEALDELHGVEAYLIDPVKGTAIMPFRKDDDLAWYVFDHFAPGGVVGWRYQNDPVEECRPLPEAKVSDSMA